MATRLLHNKLYSSLSIVLAGLLLGACSSSNQSTQDQSLSEVGAQERNEQDKASARMNAINKVRLEAKEKAKSLSEQSSWSANSDATYRQIIQQTDIVYDERSNSFVNSGSQQSDREKYLLKQSSKYPNAKSDLFYKDDYPCPN